MDHDIVVVTFNYRLGPFGFLSLEGESGNVQGNMGLHDQSILLKWVRQHIKSFGGDPDKVTLGGSNAGAVSVHLHMLSELSKGMFIRAVIQSGTAISPWVLMKDPNERVEKLAKHLKCGNDTTVETCLANLDAVKIIQKLPRLAEWYIDPLVPFGPTVEKAGGKHERFLSRSPYNILAGGEYWAKNIPVIMGVNSHEGLLHAMDIGHTGMLRRVFNLEWNGAAPISLYYKKSAVDPRSVSDAVREFYFPKIEDPLPLVDKDYHFSNLTNLYSDRHFFVPLHHSAKTMGKHNELYLYWFDYVSEQTIHGLYGYNSSHIFGPSHYDQLQYLFVTPFFNETTGEENLEFERNFLSGFSKFVKDGSPFNKDWVQVTEEMIEGSVPLLYNRIGKSSDELTLAEPFSSRVEFWNGQFIMEYSKGSFIDQLMEAGDKMANKDEL
ncbi:Venom carboxylesterase-6 [Orchesella cincta]|uniref:Venom carboxylesterase-6 n=1 Tax=Orchesella cincta TaxID=48709 RepID=A0A1D2MAM2_ORCCI|nr:Venom carboxylesterase-6 [Orchesella cincta]